MQSLCIVDQACEDDHAQHEEEDQEGELLRARLERVDQDLQARRVPGQLEQPKNPDYGEELQNVGILDVFEVVLQQHVAVKAQGGDKVDPVQGRLDEDFDGGGDDEADDELEGEPDVADELDEEEGLVGIGLSLVQRPERDIVTDVTNGHVADNGNAAVGVSLQTEGQDGDQDEEDRSEGHHLEERIEGSKCRRGLIATNWKIMKIGRELRQRENTLAQWEE